MKTWMASALVLIAAVVLITATTATSQEDMVVVDDSAVVNRLRPMPVFEHDMHNETAEIEECNVCHHVVENGVALEDESSEDSECSECHMKTEDDTMALTRAFHQRCKGCHEQQGKGPVMCGQCHRRDR